MTTRKSAPNPNGLFALFAIASMFAVPICASAQSTSDASWAFNREVRVSTCTLRYVTPRITLHFARRFGYEEAVMRLTGSDMPEEFPFYWQTNSTPRHRLIAYEDRAIGAYRIAGHATEVDSHDLLLELEPVERLSIAVTARTVYGISMGNFSSAFASYRKCISELTDTATRPTTIPVEPEQNAKLQVDEDEPNDLAETLADHQSAVIGSFHCEVTQSVFLGIPDIMGTDKSTTVTLDILEDGTANYNGSRVQAQLAEKQADGSIDFVTYDVRQIMNATVPDANAPPVLLNDEEAQDYARLLGAANSMFQMALGNRSRSLFVSLKHDTVTFLDHVNGNQISNERAPQCIRVR